MKTYDLRTDLYTGEFAPGSIGCEIGVFFGDNAEDLFRIVQPAKLHLIDPWAPMPMPGYGGDKRESQSSRLNKTRDRLEQQIIQGRVIIHVGPAEVVLPTLQPVFDWIYIDGDHRFKSALRDLYMATNAVVSGGIIAAHDYYPKDDWETGEIGVYEAVQEFISETSWEVSAVAKDSCLLRDGVSV